MTHGTTGWGASRIPTTRRDGRRELVHTVLGQVSEKARIVLTLQELEGRSIKEIAEITGWSISPVKVQAFRARKEMQAAVERFLSREERL